MSRSLKKGPYVSSSLLKKIDLLNKKNSKSIIMTWSRSTTIIPIMLGHTIAVYNGREHIALLISDQMIGYKLGEFVQTRNYFGHTKSDKKAKK
uniref:Small ribosomal subunit protein uS19c n=1 Tax=Trachelomonas volvocina TaxID=103340 RepID=A0A0G3VP44_9EUGL|nr:ribosomal protein S19 [Trachelomonas volvocina]AKL82436.1 ribosomal protein S19 [Trachelomonas volvocina]